MTKNDMQVILKNISSESDILLSQIILDMKSNKVTKKTFKNIEKLEFISPILFSENPWLNKFYILAKEKNSWYRKNASAWLEEELLFSPNDKEFFSGELELGVYAVNPFKPGRPLVRIDWKQGWFWQPEWLQKELEAEKNLKLENGETFDTMEDFLEGLK